MSDLIVLKAGEKIESLRTVPGDYEDWIVAGLDNRGLSVRTVPIYRGATLPPAADVRAVVITGSAANVTDQADWMVSAASWIGSVIERRIPVLGICFGHQLLAHALGGEVRDNPRGLEVGTVRIHLTEFAATDVLFNRMPAVFDGNVSHRQSVSRLPPGAIPLAFSDLEPIQAFHVPPSTWGIQFHPEFDAEISRAHVAFYGAQLRIENRDPVAIAGHCRDTPVSAAIPAGFLATVE